MKKQLLLTIFLLTTLSGCINPSDFEDLKLNVNTSLPLGSMSFDDKDLLELASVSSLNYDQNDVAFIRERTSLDLIKESDLKSIFDISTQTIDLNLKLKGGEGFDDLINSGQPIPIPEDTNTEYLLKLEDLVEVENIILSEGIVYLKVDNERNYRGMSCTIDEITKNGVPITFRVGEIKNLKGYKIQPIDNKITVETRGTVSNTNSIDCQVIIDEMAVDNAVGFFGSKELDKIETKLVIDEGSKEFFNYIDEFYIANPSLTLSLKSDINIPTLILISEMSVDGKPLQLKKGFNNDRFLVDSGEEIIKITNSDFVDENALSNAITSSISSVKVVVTTILNPTKEQIGADIPISKVNTFNATSKIKGDLDVDIPINGYFKNITFNDKFKMDLGDDIKKYDYRHISYAITGENTFPLGIILKLYTEDNKGKLTPLGSDFTTIPSALNNVNPKNGTVNPGVINDANAKIITLNESDSKRFMNAEQIVFEIKASSTNIDQKQIINFYKGLKLNFNMIIGVDGTIKF